MEVRQFQVVVLQKTARNCFKTIRAAREARLFFPRSPNQILYLWCCCYRSRHRC